MKSWLLLLVLLSGCTADQVRWNAAQLEDECRDLGGLFQWTLENGKTVSEFSCILNLPVAWVPNRDFKYVPPLTNGKP